MGGQLLADGFRWRWAAASITGTSHHKGGARKQDAFAISKLQGGGICAVVSDGAGSASHGGQGASLVCRALISNFRDWFSKFDILPDDEQLFVWIDDLRDLLALVAERRGLVRRQFAATLVMLVVYRDDLLALQVGDSSLVARREGRWEAICWPENGEYASTTFFVTDDPDVQLRIARLPACYDAFALFSDGLEGIALDHSELCPHPRFLDPMLKPIDAASSCGRLPELSRALGRFLSGQSVCDRTDDDKTLILLSGL